MGALQLVEPFDGAACALALAAEVEKEEANREGDEGETCRLPRPWPGQKPGQ